MTVVMAAIAAATANDSVILAALAVVSLLASGLVLLAKTYAQAKQANNAVNNVAPGEHSLWDTISFIREDVAELLESQREFSRRGWSTLPADIGTAAALTETIRAIQRDLTELRKDLEDHDRWERENKYKGETP